MRLMFKNNGNNIKGIDPTININNRRADILIGNSFRDIINKTITSTETRKTIAHLGQKK